MKIFEIYNILNEISPFDLQEKWDNSGLNIGHMQEEIENIFLSLDISSLVIEKLPKNSLLITHHPLIFSPLKQINNSFPSNIIKQMIRKNISLICMHTNFDKTHLNKYVFEEILNFKSQSQTDFIQNAQIDMSFDDLNDYICKKLSLPYRKYIKSSKKNISSISMTTGSGASLLEKIKSDCFLTGDIKYHDGMKAKELDIALIDIGHFESEIYFANILEKLLIKKDIKTNIANSICPFSYI